MLVEESDLAEGEDMNRLAAEVELCLMQHNLEYENKPSNSAIRCAHRWGRRTQFSVDAWRGGGTVEQYKQPHLVPDLTTIDSFQFADGVHIVSAD